MQAGYKPYQLNFKQPVLTSRGEMVHKNGYFLTLTDGIKSGIGECSFIEGLSADDLSNYEAVLQTICRYIEKDEKPDSTIVSSHPSIVFGLECALLDFKNGGKKIFFDSLFTKGKKHIPINGLVWMGKKDFMQKQIQEKLSSGFTCIKIKVGAIDFVEEVSMLRSIRKKFPADKIEIRLDANGAFNATDVFKKLETLAAFQIHSIEQPVRKGQLELMMRVCKQSPIPVALDEELIGVHGTVQDDVLSFIRPKYIILKPSLLGGFAVCDEWIRKAEKQNIEWWATSALESNIGLNAIAQWVFTKKSKLVQGLGTGSLYTNNIVSPLYIENGNLGYSPKAHWGNL
ncbi:MAG: o-succinylbenzoate synthase [Bacteroidetes bacterium]|nr:o-succinylbenzoate synthase [Bacteroidota bacterium]